MTFSGKLRRVAQSLRHHRMLRQWETMWNMVRPLYRAVLSATSRRGVLVVVGGTPVRMDPAYVSTSFETVEAASYAAIKQLLHSGDVFFDVGAAIGCYTLVAADRIGPTGKIIAFEPDPEARGFLRRHLEWNEVADRVVVREMCCTSQSGNQDLFVSPTDIGGQASLFPQPGFNKIVVPATSLDEEYDRTGYHPKIVKIDVEGAEWDVLQGAVKLLDEVRPVLLLSIHPAILETRGVSEAQILSWLEQRGYGCTILERDHEVHILAKALEAKSTPLQSG